MNLHPDLIPHAIRKAGNRGYVAPVTLPTIDNPFTLGRLAAQHKLELSIYWPERVQAGWRFEQRRAQSSEHSCNS